jgi:5-methylcytosine-specific restriction endonuclease McrA
MVNKLKQERKERNKKDKESRILTKTRDGNACVVCGSTLKGLNVHHIINRQNKELRHDINNLITLCVRCHKYSYQLSAHKNSFVFVVWLEKHRPEQYAYLKRYVGGNNEENI